jgi:hypothetical protein
MEVVSISFSKKMRVSANALRYDAASPFGSNTVWVFSALESFFSHGGKGFLVIIFHGRQVRQKCPGVRVRHIGSGFPVKGGAVFFDLFSHVKHIIRIEIVAHGWICLSFPLSGGLKRVFAKNK